MLRLCQLLSYLFCVRKYSSLIPFRPFQIFIIFQEQRKADLAKDTESKSKISYEKAQQPLPGPEMAGHKTARSYGDDYVLVDEQGAMILTLKSP